MNTFKLWLEMTTDFDSLCRAVVKNPNDGNVRLILADFLEENGWDEAIYSVLRKTVNEKVLYVTKEQEDITWNSSTNQYELEDEDDARLIFDNKQFSWMEVIDFVEGGLFHLSSFPFGPIKGYSYLYFTADIAHEPHLQYYRVNYYVQLEGRKPLPTLILKLLAGSAGIKMN